MNVNVKSKVLYITAAKPHITLSGFVLIITRMGSGAIDICNMHIKITLIRLKMHLKYGDYKGDYIY